MAATTSILDLILHYLAGIWYVWLAGTVIFGIATVWYWMERLDLQRYASEILVRKACSKNKTTLGSITDMAGTEIEFECLTDKDKPGLVKNKNTLINPNLVAASQRGRLTNGIATLHYILPYFFPMGIRDAAALIQIVELIRKEAPQLNWIEDDLVIVKLFFGNDKYLHEDCVDTVHSYLAMGIEIPYGEDEDDVGEDDICDVNGDVLNSVEEPDDDDEEEEGDET